MSAEMRRRQAELDAKRTSSPSAKIELQPIKTRAERAGKIIDEILESGDEKSQTRVALEVLKMDKPKEEGERKAFGSVVIQGKLSLEDWNEMRAHSRSAGK